MCKNLWLLSILLMFQFAIADGDFESAWQSEWGGYEMTGKPPTVTGGTLGIYDCDSSTKTCVLQFRSENRSDDCNGQVNLKFPSEGKAYGTVYYESQPPQDCVVNLSLNTKNGRSEITAIWSGKSCSDYCTGPVLRKDYPFLDQKRVLPYYSTECYLDRGKAKQIWCKSPVIQKLDGTLAMLSSYKNNYDPGPWRESMNV